MRTFIAPLEELAEYDEIRRLMKKKEGIIAVTGCPEAEKAHMLYGLSYDAIRTVVVTENDMTAKQFHENLKFYEPDAYLYPSKDLLFYQADAASNLLDQQRMRVFKALGGKGKVTVIMAAPSLMDFVSTRRSLMDAVLVFKVDAEMDFTGVQKALVSGGYVRCPEVDQPGQFSVRGDILDVWSLVEENPVRIEFFGDEIESMRSFDSVSQRKIEDVEQFEVYPASDRVGRCDTVLSWFDKDETQFFLDEPNHIQQALAATETEYTESVKNRVEQKTFVPGQIPDILGEKKTIARLSALGCVSFSLLEPTGTVWKGTERFSMTVQAVNAYNKSFETLVSDLERYKRRGYRVVLLSGSHTRARRLAGDLSESGVEAFYTEDRDLELMPGQVAVEYGHASRGFEYPMIRFAVITETDIFGEREIRRKRRKQNEYSGQRIASFSELSVGDYVVHENHGLGIYRGIEQVEVDGSLKDYIKIEYNGSNLYILATQLDRLQKYASEAADVHPRLNKLGGQEWSRTTGRVKKAVKSIAKELVALYAARSAAQGFKYSPDTEWQREFEELFPYEETEDQLAAIEDTKRDMESGKIMDRLVCGDVGYGKTEIAIRAAFKAVQDGKQVAFLVPTTILAQQHYNTFTQRMMDYPVRVDLMNRFRSSAQQQRTLKDLKSGMVDIVIGTHRILSKDIKFKDLGLLIIDEEQRFGVTHKEKIKSLRKNVDVLALTATPIPRTLHMSLIGIRDMSVLEEPPEDRVPIQTYVMEYNTELVREAICREMARGGQVYYVYNRVKEIADVARRIQALIPEANVAYANGQMKENELSPIMNDFINGDIDVLITTTIIETGLDISNANTIIICDADRMGLSQLYQLRGRVGRSNRTAYAFLMYRRDKQLKEVAEKRLAAVKEFTALGSGFKIAMRDLEIRGAGNMLGAEQSGHMESVGYDLYCKMLSSAVAEAKGETVEEDFETVVDLAIDAYIPSFYIENEFQKLDFYKRIAGIQDDHDYSDLGEEMEDRFGQLPTAVKNLLMIANLKAYAHRASVTEIKQNGSEVTLRIKENPAFDTTKVPDILMKHAGDFQIRVYKTETVFLYKGDVTPGKMVGNLKTFVKELADSSKSDYNA